MPIPQLTWKDKQKKDKRPRKPIFKKGNWKKNLLPILGITFIAGVIIIIAVFAWFSKDLPDPDKLIERQVAQSTKIYDRTGEQVLYEISGEERRTIIPLEEIPDYMEWATVAAEDHNFYQHTGFNLKRIITAVVKDVIQRRKAEGASTITQQFVKNAILTIEKTWTRKIKEAILTYQIERKFSKDQILQMYLNEIPYGSNFYGIESAANGYFGKSAKELTLAESAILAALPQAPTYYSPYGSHQDDLIWRQQWVLDQMVELDFITAEEAEGAKNQELTYSYRSGSIQAPHFVMYVKEILTEKYGEKIIEQGGLKVFTTLDMQLQEMAEQAVENGAAKYEQYGAGNAALVAVDPKNGEILTMVGSRDYFDLENDGNVNVTIRDRQPGSSFKPIAYASAFQKGFTPETMLFDLVTDFGTGGTPYTPKNYDLAERGPVSMRQALAGSLNIPAVKTLYLAGVDNVLDLAHEMGYTTLNDRERYGLSLVLGGGEVKLLDHVAAFSVFAREGKRHPVAAILRIEDSSGEILEEKQDVETEVLDEEACRQINSVLSDNSARAYVFGGQNYLNLGSRQVAAKTGTTQDYRDAWTIGYTPSLATGVWVGNNDNTEMNLGAAGSVVAAPIWHEFMDKATANHPLETFKAPASNKADKPILRGEIDTLAKVKVDKFTNRVIPENCLSDYPEKYVVEKELKTTHNILYFVDKNNPQGDPPENPSLDPQYSFWESPVQRWASAKGDYLISDVTYEDCNLRNQPSLEPTITIESPADGAKVTSQTIEITTSAISPVAVKAVKFYIDNQLIGSAASAPYTLSYTITSLENGKHTLKAVVYNKNDFFSEDEIDFTLTLTDRSAIYYFSSPSGKTTVDTGDFPYTISVFAFDPAGIKKVELFWLSPTDNITRSIASSENPESANVNFTWEEAPAVNTYQIHFRITNTKNQVTKSNNLALTVE
ncbi:MAG: PBP1A family penicillin-binding protein [Patescibacteria group bacterium]